MAHPRSISWRGLTASRRQLAVIVATVTLLMGALAVPLAAPASAAPPPVPTGFTFTGNITTTSFYWDSSAVATRFQVMCEQDPYDDVTAVVASSPLTPTTTVDLRLPAGYNDCYMRAGNVSEWSAWGSHVLVTVPALDTPTALTTSTAYGIVGLGWAGGWGSHVDGWRVTSTPDSGVHTLLTGDVHAGKPALSISGLPIGVAYTFHIQTARTYGSSAWQYGPSVDFSPVTLKKTPGPPTVTDVSVDAYGPVGILDVSWDAPAPNSSPAINKYRVVLSRAGYDPLTYDFDATARTGHIELPGMEGVELDAVSVSAHNANGWGVLGEWVGGAVLIVRKPSSPVNLFTRVDSSNVVRVLWDGPAGTDGYLDPPQYEVVIDGPTPDTETIYDQEQYVGPGPLDPGWYEARVRAKGTQNDSAWVSRWFAVGIPCDPNFTDVGPTHAFCTPISWMVREGVGNGFPDGTFRPTQTVTRQALASFLYRAKGSPSGDDPACSAAPFPDVAIDHPFCGEIAWLVSQGITAGYGDGTFRPSASVTRQAMASFLYKASGQDPLASPAVCTNGFPAATDVPVDHSFCQYVAWIIDAGTASGYPDGTFRPSAAVSRQAMASFLYNWRP